MTAADVTLALCVVLAGLWSGLLLTVTTILHPMFRDMDGPAFAGTIQRFLTVARRSPTNWIVVFGLLLVPIAALVALPGGGTAFVLTALGLAACVAGPLLASNRLAEPNYAVMQAWDPGDPPPGWQAVRRRYFALNWLRAVLTWIAFALFGAAAYAA